VSEDEGARTVRARHPDEAWRHQPPLDPAVRRAFLDARRRSHEARMDTLHAATYDEAWGRIFPSHRAFVGRLLDLTRAHGTVLDAPCGTGKYWPLVFASGRTVVGIDQSAGMLRMAAAKHPGVPVAKVSLQALAFAGLFDAVLCIDAMENVGPEDWPLVLDRLRDAARPGAPLYLTVEVQDEAGVRAAYEAARAAGHPVVPGEDFDGVGYHFYPTSAAVAGSLEAAGLVTIDRDEADDYGHYLLRRPVR
jgi:SAM-dependent methyltransferase